MDFINLIGWCITVIIFQIAIVVIVAIVFHIAQVFITQNGVVKIKMITTIVDIIFLV